MGAARPIARGLSLPGLNSTGYSNSLLNVPKATATIILSGIEMVQMMRKRQARYVYNPAPALAKQFATEPPRQPEVVGSAHNRLPRHRRDIDGRDRAYISSGRDEPVPPFTKSQNVTPSAKASSESVRIVGLRVPRSNPLRYC